MQGNMLANVQELSLVEVEMVAGGDGVPRVSITINY